MSEAWSKVGDTSLVYIKSLSDMTGCHIWGKAEYENPGGSIKDRAAKQIILEAEGSGQLRPGETIVEGTAGNTGIGIATLAIPRGYRVVITMPNNQAQEKVQRLQELGATVIQVPPCPFADQAHFYHQARIYSEKNSGVYWANQFENLANFRAHFQNTGPEIWNQTQGMVDVFVASVGTGGTIGGNTCFLKDKKPSIETVVADPFGSGIYEYIHSGQFKSEGSSITEGIGIMRLTANFKQARVDRALRVNDQEMISMLYHLQSHDQLVVGTSAALNLVAAAKVALQYKNSKKTIVTMLCDHGDRYRSKVFSEEWLASKNLVPQSILATLGLA
ncbi:MAG: cysteine synthase [Pseudomonadota bacterium]